MNNKNEMLFAVLAVNNGMQLCPLMFNVGKLSRLR